MEITLKYVIFMIVLAFAIASTASEVQYTAISGITTPDAVCGGTGKTKSTLIPQDLWSGTADGCVKVTITNDSGSASVQVQVVGQVPDSGNTFILSSDAYPAIGGTSSEVNIIYVPPS